MKIHRPILAGVFLALSCLALSARAEDVIDNLANASSGQMVLDEFGKKAAQAFTTGPQFATLDSVTVRLRHILPPSPPFGSSTARVILFSGDGDVPETQIELVGTVTAFSDDTNFTVNSTTNTLLLPDTRYWIVVSNASGDFDWRSTTDSSVTPASTGGLPDFRATATDAEWTAAPTGNFQKMKVVATPVPGITVTNVSDNKDTPPDGSLRKAIADAHPGATIDFDSSLTEPIVLDGMELTIDKSLIIDASGVPGGITISGDRTGDGHTLDDSRVFDISGDITVVLKSLTITGGRAPDDISAGRRGGGIFNFATTTLWNCSVAHNRSGEGGDGGGIFSAGTMTLHHSTVSHNRAGDGEFGGAGGGIVVGGGTMTLWNSTVSNNRAGDSTDNVGRSGGGISVIGELILWNSTITGNRAGDGGVGRDGGHGGGIARSAGNYSLCLNNSVVAGNFVGEGGDGGNPGQGPDLSSEFQTTRSGVNLIGDNTLSGGASTVFPAPTNPGEPNANGDLVGTGAAPLDPLLGPLADNGGPTQTHLPLRGSPAIDPPNGATESLDLPTDQRGEGFPRIVVGVQDIGAVEAPDYAAIDAAAAAGRASKKASLSKKLKKLKKKAKNAKRKGQAAKAKKFKGQIKKLTNQLRAL